MKRGDGMKFSVGYQMLSDNSFTKKIIEYKDSISEMYFSFGDFPNGRARQTERRDMSRNEVIERQLYDLGTVSAEGISLNVLFNATCYGADSQSREFFVCCDLYFLCKFSA